MDENKKPSATQKQQLPASIRDAIKTHAGSKAMVKRIYEEGTSLKASLAAAQDELENWRTRYHESDKQAGILGAQVKSSVLAEIIKFLLSAVVTSIGINLLTDSEYILGGGIVALAVIFYVGIIALGKVKNR